MEFLVSCQYGLEKVVKKEIKRLGGKITSFDKRHIYFDGNDKLMVDFNLWSRCANKLYKVLAKKNIVDFDSLFNLVFDIDWARYIPEDSFLMVDANIKNSLITSKPSIQSISKKAILKKLYGEDSGYVRENKLNTINIEINIIDDEALILLNTTGEPLYKRGYKTNSYTAPINESLAAAIIDEIVWKYSTPFIDGFCGSGTFVIEAAMIAKNIAPGLTRKFDFLKFPYFDNSIFEKQKKLVESKKFLDNDHTIIGMDINPEAISIAKQHAKLAGVGEYIKFEQKDIFDYKSDEGVTFLSNPPYGMRLNQSDVEDIHVYLIDMFEKTKGIAGGFFSGYEYTEDMIQTKNWLKKLYFNGGEKANLYRFYKRD